MYLLDVLHRRYSNSDLRVDPGSDWSLVEASGHSLIVVRNADMYPSASTPDSVGYSNKAARKQGGFLKTKVQDFDCAFKFFEQDRVRI